MIVFRKNIAACGLVLSLLFATGAAAQQPEPSDFKIKLAIFEAGDTPLETSELVAHQGRVYQFRADSTELVIVRPASSRIDLVDIDANHRAQTSVTFRKINDELEKLRAAIAAAIAKREKAGGRANRLKAEMTRDLIEPRLAATFDTAANRLTLKGGSAEVTATGDLDPDLDRLALLGAVLPALVKLESMREPESIPPYTELETLSILIGEKRLRPTEVSILFRLAGPPRKARWTYQLVPTLTAREREAVARVDQLCKTAPSLSYNEYEKQHAK
jgi:hypothetical protein